MTLIARSHIRSRANRYRRNLVAFAVAVMVMAVPAQNLWANATANGTTPEEEAILLGEQFGVIVGEVDKETAEFLGLQRAGGVVVYEVIAGKPAHLAGIKVQAIIKEIDKHEIRDLVDFGEALREALKTENFSVATYQPPDPDNQGVAGGLNFHFVRIEEN